MASFGIDPALQACLAAAGDPRPSLAAKGLLLTLLAHPEARVGGAQAVVAACNPQEGPPRHGQGRDAVYDMLSELEETGYVRRERARRTKDGYEPAKLEVVVPADEGGLA